MRITGSVHILPDSVRLNGRPVPVESLGADLPAELYRTRGVAYPKFFKMDLLCKLGFMATELLVENEPDRFTPREDRAVLLFSRSGPLCNDRNYQDTIAEGAYFPSPALFVYTLANIVTGEIAICNKYEGDTTAFCLETFSPEALVAAVGDAFEDRCTTSAICGWVECVDAHHYEALLFLVKQDASEGLSFTAETIRNIQQSKI